MAQYQGVEFQKLVNVGTTGAVATFEGGIQAIYVVADANCFMNLETTSTGSNGMLIVANTQANQFLFPAANVKQVYFSTASGTANVYLIGVRGAT